MLWLIFFRKKSSNYKWGVTICTNYVTKIRFILFRSGKTRSAHCGVSKRIVDEDLLVLIHVEFRDEDSVVAHIDQIRIGLIRGICAASNFMDLWQKIVVFHRWWLGIQATAFCVVGSDMSIALCAVCGGVHSFQSEKNNKLNIGESTKMKRFAQRNNLRFQLLCSSLRNELPPVHSQNLSWLYLFVQEKATSGLWNLGPPNWKLWQPNLFCEFRRIAFIRKEPDSARFRHIHLAVRRKAWRRTTDAHSARGWCPEHFSLPKEECGSDEIKILKGNIRHRAHKHYLWSRRAGGACGSSVGFEFWNFNVDL